MSDDARWRLAAREAPPIRYWGGDYVVYNPLSGDTHLLDIVSGEVLRAVVAGPVARATICGRVAALLELPADRELASNVDGILARLDDLGLIEPAC